MKRLHPRSLASAVRRRIAKFRNLASARPPVSTSQAIERIQRSPGLLVNWLDLISLVKSGFPDSVREQIHSHNLTRDGVILSFQEELEKRMAADFLQASKRLNHENIVPICCDLAADMIRLKTIVQCRDAHAEGNYYRDAEPYMPKQWKELIWPIVKDLGFREVLELAPGHGRNTEFLCRHAGLITPVDVNPNCINACKERFGEKRDGCLFRYHVTDGDSLAMVESGSHTLVCFFDSMVHFDSSVVRAYVHEIARVLRPGGSAFLHHFNYSAVAPNSDWAHNPGSRSDMTAERMREFAEEAGLEELDAFTVLRRLPLS